MALSPEEREVKRQFDTRGKRRTSDLKKNVDSINHARDELLNKTMIQEMDRDADAYLRRRYGTRYISFIPSDPTKKVEEFIKSKDSTGKYYVSMDDKLDIIGEHRNNKQLLGGSDKFSADLADTQKIKADAKRRYRETADGIIEDYQKLVDENLKLISTIEKDIADKKAQISAEESRKIDGPGENTVMGANGTVKIAKKTQEEYDAEKVEKDAKIADLKAELARLEAQLQTLKDNHNLYVREFAIRKNEIEAMLAKAKIFSGAEQQPTDEKSEGKEENTTVMTTTGNNSLKDIAKSMMKDFFDRSPEEQKLILEQCGSRDLLNAAKHLGVFDRRKLARVLEERLDEMNGSITFTDRNGHTATMDHDKLFGNAGRGSKKKIRLTKDELRIVNDEISAFYEQLDNKTPQEISEFEDKIKYLRYATYMQETGWFRNITRRFDAFRRGSTNYQVGELSRRLGRYASLKNEREINQENQVNKWRKTLKLDPKSDYSKTNPRALNRTGEDSLLRQDYVQR